ncbi:helix-turn-helix transcriptional regulator [Paraburkholderia ferrariae]|uniref:helix-turn-helix transcriptional regulator n=1 Tax=Paraburkholderia ferrariae TaxID=386056 RepID=UPI0012EBF9C9|nr:helix-turn-helix domain-containing protein [Paraburkholderia ferrariae]
MARTPTPDLSINFDEWLRLRLAQHGQGSGGQAGAQIDEQRELRIARPAVQLYAENHPRPPHVTIKQAAEMLGLSRHTVSKMVKMGTFKLNKCGLIPITQVDTALLPV